MLGALAEDVSALLREELLLLATLMALPRELLGKLDTPLLPDQAPLTPFVVVARSAPLNKILCKPTNFMIFIAIFTHGKMALKWWLTRLLLLAGVPVEQGDRLG